MEDYYWDFPEIFADQIPQSWWDIEENEQWFESQKAGDWMYKLQQKMEPVDYDEQGNVIHLKHITMDEAVEIFLRAHRILTSNK